MEYGPDSKIQVRGQCGVSLAGSRIEHPRHAGWDPVFQTAFVADERGSSLGPEAYRGKE
jgi:hypothetical protein